MMAFDTLLACFVDALDIPPIRWLVWLDNWRTSNCYRGLWMSLEYPLL